MAVVAGSTTPGAGAASSDPSVTATLADGPLFAVTEPDPSIRGVPSLTVAALAAVTRQVDAEDGDGGWAAPRRSRVCAAFVHPDSVTLAAGHGAVYRVRGDGVEIVLDARGLPAGTTVPTQTGDIFALCNAGLLASVPAARISWVLRSPGPATLLARRLLAFAHQTGDAAGDAAVVVFRVGD